MFFLLGKFEMNPVIRWNVFSSALHVAYEAGSLQTGACAGSAIHLISSHTRKKNDLSLIDIFCHELLIQDRKLARWI